MTANELVKLKLEGFPLFRERSQRGVFLTKLALRATDLELKAIDAPLTLQELTDFAIKFATYERAWRDVLSLKENAHLRGSDYDHKAELESKKLSELGYTVAFTCDQKKLDEYVENNNK